MKKTISVLRSYFGHVGFYFLLTMLVFGVVSLVASAQAVNLILIWVALLFAALVGAADGVFALKFLGSYVVKSLVYVILTVIAFAVSFVGVSGLIERGRTAVIGVMAFAAVMILITVVRCVIHSLLAKKDNESKGYDYLYMPKN